MSRGKNTQQNTEDDFWRDFGDRLTTLVSEIIAWCQVVGGKIANFFRCNWQKMMRAYTRWVDPKLDKYRDESQKSKKQRPDDVNTKKTSKENDDITAKEDDIVVDDEDFSSDAVEIEPIYKIPKNLEEFLELMSETPEDVITENERNVIAGAMSFSDTKVRKVMIPANKIIYVKSDEVLGPLVLDELYRADYTHFPVIDQKENIIGILHTANFNLLTSKDTPIAEDVIDKNICYLRSDYSLSKALTAFCRANCQLMLVVDKGNNLVGMLTFQKLIEYITGPIAEDDFYRDNDREAVVAR